MTPGSVSPAAAVRKLPVFRSTAEVFAGVTRHFFELLRLALVPIVLSFGIFFAAAVWMNDPELVQWAFVSELPVEAEPSDTPATTDEEPSRVLFYLAVLVSYLVYVPAVVRWHRFVLFGEGSASHMLRWEDTRYLIVAVKLAIAFMFFLIPAAILAMGIGWIGEKLIAISELGDDALVTPQNVAFAAAVIVGYIVATAIFFRLGMALPDAAAGGKGRIEDMIERTRGNTWRLIWLNTFILVGMGVLAAVYDVVVNFVLELEALSGMPLFVLAMLLNVPLVLYVSMLSVTMLSVAYREIVGLPDDAAPATPAPEPLPAD